MAVLIDPKKKEDARRELLNPDFSRNKPAPEPRNIAKREAIQNAANGRSSAPANLDSMLFSAIQKKDLNEVHRLVKAGANPDSSAFPMLEQAALVQAYEIIKALVSYGAKPTPSAFINIASFGKLDLLQLLIDNGADVDIRNHGGKTALMFTSEHGISKSVEFLLDKGADVNLTDSSGETALTLAVDHMGNGRDNLEVVRMLLKKGANPDARCRSESSSGTPLRTAIDNGNVQLAQLLIEHGADVNLRKDYEMMPLELAIGWDNKAIIKLLKEHGAKRRLFRRWFS